jgi:aldehyde:ferredoxin oxidoreductase
MAEYGKDCRVCCIGPSGEKLALIASIMTDHGSAAGRSGLGAVMGSKKLKAVAARGKPEIPIADKETVNKLRMAQIKHLQSPGPDGHSFMEMFHRFGTSGLTHMSAHSGDTPVKNWGGIGVIDLPDREGLKAEVVEAGVAKLSGCWHCPIACKATLKEGTGEYKYAAGARRPEYETQGSFGANCANSNTESINMVNDICNRYGLDTISAGTVISFATECYENHILTKEDTDGIELTWGNHRAMVAMTEKMARREGLGNILADGVKVAAQKIGKGADKFAVHIGGQEVGMHDPKLSPPGVASSAAARYHLDATPGRHTQGFGPSGFEGHLVNLCGVCLMGFGFGNAPKGVATFAEFLNAVTGLDFTVEELLKVAERVVNLRHAFNLREGIIELNWTVHPRIIGNPPQSSGPLAGVTVDLEAQDYWNLGALDWDMLTTKPSQKKLMDLGLQDVAEQLYPPKK